MSGKLCYKEFIEFAKELNLTSKKINYKDLFTSIDIDNSKTIELNEFINYYKKFSSGEEFKYIFEEFAEYSFNKKQRIINSEGLIKFYEKIQKKILTENQANFLIANLIPTIPEEEKESLLKKINGEIKLEEEEEKLFELTLEEFKNLLYDKNLNNILDYQKMEANDPMNFPLNDYYIFSSHNTYLTGHQIYGSCKAEMYSNALLLGCRLVELDVYNGKDEDGPMVKHGFTMTGEILLKDCLTHIAESAFKISDYPVILSIENHCDENNQIKMGHQFKDILKNLFIIEEGTELKVFPSPDDLKRKFIIKVKKFFCFIYI